MTPERWSHTSPAQHVTVGSGALAVTGELLRALGVRRALLVTTSGRMSSAGGDQVVSALGRTLVATFDGVEPHVPASAVQEVAAMARREGVDGLVSFGGGSAIDTAKALGFFSEHESGTPGSSFTDRPLLPHVAIPTTLAGAAFTGSFSMIDPQSRRSNTTAGPTVVPAAVLIDPELGADLPAELLAGSIATALAHGIEASWAPDRSPEAEALALAGLVRLARAAAGAIAEPGDIERRAALVEGAVLCGRARQNASDGLHHALAQLVGARTGMPHGWAHAALLAVTAAYTAEAVPAAAARVEAALGTGSGGLRAGISELLSSLGSTSGLDDLGVTDDDIEAVTRQSGAQRAVQTNPRPTGEADVRALLEAAW